MPVEEERKKEAAVVVAVEEAGEAVVRSDGFVFLHNGGAKRPQTVGLWGVFPSSARDVLPCKCFCHVFAFLSSITRREHVMGDDRRDKNRLSISLLN